jgi:DNA-binding MarR family transcriptional regulator
MTEDAGRAEELARALIDIVPRLLRRIGADVPLDEPSTEHWPGWREVVELRATPGQLTLLRVLVDQGRCTMQQLAEHLGVAPSTATAMVKRLLAQGYIERSRGEDDWRTVHVAVTEVGRRAVEAFERARSISLQGRLARLSPEERALLLAALPALRHLMEV